MNEFVVETINKFSYRYYSVRKFYKENNTVTFYYLRKVRSGKPQIIFLHLDLSFLILFSLSRYEFQRIFRLFGPLSILLNIFLCFDYLLFNKLLPAASLEWSILRNTNLVLVLYFVIIILSPLLQFIYP